MHRRRELDGVRGIAILLVMAAHLAVPGFASGGVAGVTLFFVLSGYLITGILLRNGLAGFWRNRALRLLPALLLVIVATTAYGVTVGTRGIGSDDLVALLYLSNWYRASGHWMHLLSHTWSLSIEEQFYLMWPLVVLAFRRSPLSLAVVCVAGALASVADRVFLWHGAASINRVYFATDTRADGLLLGCALAAWVASGRRLTGRWMLLAAAAAMTAAMAPSGNFAVYVLAPGFAAVAGVLLIAYAGRFASAALRWRPLAWTGTISYGLYLWHVPIVWVLLPRLADWPLVARASLVLALAYTLATTSYYLVEVRFLRLKKRAACRSTTASRPQSSFRRLPAQ